MAPKTRTTEHTLLKILATSGRVSSILATNVLFDLVLALPSMANVCTFLKTEDTAKNSVLYTANLGRALINEVVSSKQLHILLTSA